MAFTATLDSVVRGGDPLTFDVGVTYLDSDTPDWRVSKILHVTLDPAQTPAQQRAALVALVRADAAPYKQQLATHAGLVQALAQSIVITI